MKSLLTASGRLSRRQIFSLFIAVTAIWVGIISGCAPLPPVEEEKVITPQTDTAPTISQAERDSIIAVYRSFAYERWKNGDYENARKHFNTVRSYDTEHKINIYRSWSDCFVRSNLLDSARIVYEEGIRYFPNDDYLRSSLSIVYRNAGMTTEAIREAKEVVRIKPDDIRGWKELVSLYEANEMWDDAIKTYKKLIQLEPDNKTWSDAVTAIVRQRYSPEQFIAELRSAVAQFPDDPMPRLQLADALMEQGQSFDASKEYDTYTKMKPDDVSGWRGLAHARENLGEWQGVLTALKKVIELQPNSAQDITDIARAYLSLKQYAEARRWSAKALEAENGFGPAYVVMAEAYYRAADEAAGDNTKYDDKLVFTVAYMLFKNAANTSNPQARSDGERGMRQLAASELVPSKEEQFMHQKDTRPTGKAYAWIDGSWFELKLIDQFLKDLK